MMDGVINTGPEVEVQMYVMGTIYFIGHMLIETLISENIETVTLAITETARESDRTMIFTAQIDGIDLGRDEDHGIETLRGTTDEEAVNETQEIGETILEIELEDDEMTPLILGEIEEEMIAGRNLRRSK